MKRWSSFFSRHRAQRQVANDSRVVQPEKIGILGHPPTQARVQGVNDGPVASVTLLDEICAAMVEEGMVKGGVQHPSFPCPERRCRWSLPTPGNETVI